MRRRTAILVALLAVVLVGAATYAISRSSRDGEPAKGSAQAARPAAQAPRRPVRERAAHKRASRKRAHKHKARHSARKRGHHRARTAPDLGEFTGGFAAPDEPHRAPVTSRPAPIASRPAPVVSRPAPEAAPPAAAPAAPAAQPAAPPTPLDLITTVIAGPQESPAAPQPDAGAPPCTPTDSGPGSANSGHGHRGDTQTDGPDVVSAIIEALCASADAAPEHGGDSGSSSSDGSGGRSGSGKGK